MKIVCFEPDYDAQHREVLRAFAAGCGAEVAPVTRYEDCEVAVIFGLVKKSFRKSWSKAEILARHGPDDPRRRLIVCEAAPVRRGDYWAVGWNGQAGRADFCNKGVPSDRWDGFGVKAAPYAWKTLGGPGSGQGATILVCGQLLRDTTVQDLDHAGWCRAAVAHYSQFGRTVFRPHPREDPDAYGIPPALHDRRPLAEALGQAQLVVTWNSTAGVDAALAGVPVVACDRGSFAWPVASHGLEAAPRRPDRAAWLAGLGYAQWTLEELRAGLAWRHLSRGLPC